MAIDAKMVKQLRDETGAAMLDCKNALESNNGDFEKAKAFLAEKGLATARKKSDREARDGRIETYSHPGARVGVMVEVNCETDFVARNDLFLALCKDIALHVAFSNPRYVDIDVIPAAELDAQKQVFLAEARETGKPEAVIEKIVEGRLNKWYAETCLLKQPFVKDEDITVGELVTKAIAEIKENIRVARFARFELGNPDAQAD